MFLIPRTLILTLTLSLRLLPLTLRLSTVPTTRASSLLIPQNNTTDEDYCYSDFDYYLFAHQDGGAHCSCATDMPTTYADCSAAAFKLGMRFADETGRHAQGGPFCGVDQAPQQRFVSWNSEGTVNSLWGGFWRAVCRGDPDAPPRCGASGTSRVVFLTDTSRVLSSSLN